MGRHITRYLNRFAEFRRIVADREDMQDLSEYEIMLLWHGYCVSDSDYCIAGGAP